MSILFCHSKTEHRTQNSSKILNFWLVASLYLLKLPPAHLLLREYVYHLGWKPAFVIYCSNLKTSNHLFGPLIISTCTLQPESVMLCDESWPLTGRGHSSATWNMIPGVEVKRSLSQKSKCTPRCWGHLTQHTVIFLQRKLGCESFKFMFFAWG